MDLSLFEKLKDELAELDTFRALGPIQVVRQKLDRLADLEKLKLAKVAELDETRKRFDTLLANLSPIEAKLDKLVSTYGEIDEWEPILARHKAKLDETAETVPGVVYKLRFVDSLWVRELFDEPEPKVVWTKAEDADHVEQEKLDWGWDGEDWESWKVQACEEPVSDHGWVLSDSRCSTVLAEEADAVAEFNEKVHIDVSAPPGVIGHIWVNMAQTPPVVARWNGWNWVGQSAWYRADGVAGGPTGRLGAGATPEMFEQQFQEDRNLMVSADLYAKVTASLGEMIDAESALAAPDLTSMLKEIVESDPEADQPLTG